MTYDKPIDKAAASMYAANYDCMLDSSTLYMDDLPKTFDECDDSTKEYYLKLARAAIGGYFEGVGNSIVMSHSLDL